MSRIEVDEGGFTCYWNDNDLLHREDGPAVFHPNGVEEWCFNGKYHREGGPALKYFDGTEIWFIHDELHRLDGPAVVDPELGLIEWWINGEQINCSSQEEFEQLLKLKSFW